VAELAAQLPLALDPPWPVDDGAVAGPAPVGGDLLGPLEGGVHRPGPADRVVVVGLRPAELVQPLGHERRRLQRCHGVEVDHLVERALDGALGRGAVVADDQIDQGVVHDPWLLDGVQQSAHVMVGVGHEPGIDLHLALKDRLQLLGHVVPGRDLGVPLGQLGIGRDHPQLLLPGEGQLALAVPAVGEAALVPLDPLGGHMVGGVGGAGGEVHEERLVGHQRLLRPHPVDRMIGQVLGEVVALLRGLGWLHRGGALVQRRVPLVVLAADEAVEVLEPRPGRPHVKRPHRLD
jgi:hypothetical protein